MAAREKIPDVSSITAKARDIARGVLRRWLSTGLARDPEEINRGAARGGSCEDFSRDLIESLNANGIEAEDLSIVQFLRPDADGENEGRPFDRALLKKYWKSIVPTTKTSWKDWDELSEYHNFNHGTHIFTYAKDVDLWFDSECVDGVTNFLELPFFQRAMARWREEKILLNSGITP